MIQNEFVLAFKVNVFHTYFEENICKCLWFEIGANTKNIFKRFNCKIRNRTNGFDFYINSKNELSEFFNYLKNATNNLFFDFDIRSNNLDFFYFTEFPADWVGEVIFNSQANSNSIKDNVVQLSETLSESMFAAKLGKVIIYFDDIIKYKSDNGCANFNIQFTAKATQWQYIIINKTGALLNKPSIVGHPDFDFLGPEFIITEMGENAIVFSTGNNLIPFSEKPIYRFDLISNLKMTEDKTFKNTAASKVLFKGLPNANPKNMKKIGGDFDNSISSPMYIYL